MSVRLSDDPLEDIEAYAEEDQSRSEVVRTLLRQGLEYDDLTAERDRLRTRVRTLIEDRDQHRELVRYVEDERRHRRDREQASVVTRTEWWLFGREVSNGTEA